ncbi:MAG: HAD-IC family P-type ATPase [Pseudomonadota bacterium]
MTDTRRDDTTVWHQLNPEQALAQLGSDAARGLSADAAAARLAQHGPNRLAEQARPGPLALFLAQFKNLLAAVLFGAAVLAATVGDVVDAVVILIVLLLNGLLGFYQEYRAEQTLDALRRMLSRRAVVRRAGQTTEIDAEHLVPGDVVLLEAGDQVPADGRVLQAHSAEVGEAALTGESLPVGKSAAALAQEEVPLAERSNMAYMNTVVTRGRIELLVTATGMQTEMGRLTGLLETAEEHPTPLQVQLDQVGKKLALIAGVVVTLIFILGLLRDQPLVESILTAIALAVAAIPEGLPAVVTVTLAVGMHRMAKKRAIVKRLAAVETLGCTTVICSDKTGTLTLNQMNARALFFRGRRIRLDAAEAPGRLDALLVPAVLCNDARFEHGRVIGDPTEGALIRLASDQGMDIERLARRFPRVAEIPFDSAHKYMATFHLEGDQVSIWIKGAPDVLLELCSSVLGDEGSEAINTERRAVLAQENEALADAAMRVLAVAEGRVPAARFDAGGDLTEYIRDLTFIGLVGIIDPPRPEAREAIKLCASAGIEVKMITGDHRITARAVARELGLHGEVITGAELDRLEGEALIDAIRRAAVFARVAPEHKVQIVRVLKGEGHVVAMTGDGVNDAPAIKNADIGVAMGLSGTEVTKEAADMVLTDDNFATLVGAVQEGRTIYDNIVKFVRFQLSTNIGAILTVFSVPLTGLPVPFTPIQILFINIIMDGPPAMTLGLEPARPGLMQETPRPRDERILSAGRIGRLLVYGLTMTVGTLGVLYWALQHHALPYALTLGFTTFVFFQLFNVFNARAEYGSAFNGNFFRNGKLWLALLGVALMQVLVVHWAPLQRVFHTTDLAAPHWLLAIAVASSILLLDEARKLLQRLLFRAPKPDHA